jgi:hypothetical protein
LVEEHSSSETAIVIINIQDLELAMNLIEV